MSAEDVGAVKAPTIRRSIHANDYDNRSRHRQIGLSGVLAETRSDRRWLVERSGFGVRWQLSCDHLLLRHWHRVQEGLHRRFAEAPTSLMRPLFIVLADP